jgi:hypothetical protein
MKCNVVVRKDGSLSCTSQQGPFGKWDAGILGEEACNKPSVSSGVWESVEVYPCADHLLELKNRNVELADLRAAG